MSSGTGDPTKDGSLTDSFVTDGCCQGRLITGVHRTDVIATVVLTQVDPARVDLDCVLPKNGFQCIWSPH